MRTDIAVVAAGLAGCGSGRQPALQLTSLQAVALALAAASSSCGSLVNLNLQAQILSACFTI